MSFRSDVLALLRSMDPAVQAIDPAAQARHVAVMDKIGELVTASGAAGDAVARALADFGVLLGQNTKALAELVKILQPDPPGDPHKVLIGATVSNTPTFTTNWNSLVAAVGQLQAVRLFDPSEAGDPVSLFRNVAGKGLEIHSSTKSLSTDYVARLAYYQRVKATGENVVAYTYHEPDDNMDRGEFTYDQWRAAALVDAKCCAQAGIDYGICWQLFGVDGWPELIDRLVADTELLSLTNVLGLDTYQRGDTQYSQATYRPWSYNGDKITALMARMPEHLQLVLPEFGVPEHLTDADYRPTYLAAMHAQALAEKWRTVLPYNYWKPATPTSNHVSTGPEFLYDTPECREASRAIMAQMVAAGAT